MPILQYNYDGKWVKYVPGSINMCDGFDVDYTPVEELIKRDRIHGRYSVGVVGYQVAWCYACIETTKLRVHFTKEEKEALLRSKQLEELCSEENTETANTSTEEPLKLPKI